MNQDYNYFLDTNILVHASLKDFETEKHLKCQKILKKIINNNYQIFISTQILREFFAIVTNKKYIKKPLPVNVANKQINFFQSNFEILTVDEDIINRLTKLTEKYNINGQKVHDTTIIATMIEYNIKNIITYNKKDFDFFSEINVTIPEDIII